jgi:hypothetical protein
MPAAVPPGMEYRALGESYHKLPVTDFSGEVLSALASDLGVFRAQELERPRRSGAGSLGSESQGPNFEGRG